MNKQECVAKSESAKAASFDASKRATLYAATFGGNDKLTLDAIKESDIALEASVRWESFSNWHPKSRDKALRDGTLPSFMFGFN